MFRIEYLRESTDQASVCHVQAHPTATLIEAEEAAWGAALFAWGNWRATGFQIRDLDRDGEIVVAEPFDLPTK